MIILRPYQQTVIDNLFDWFYTHPTGNPIINACVGSGKSIIISELCKRIITQWPNQRILMAVASRELVVQNYEKLHHLYPDADCGLYSGSLGKKNPHAQIVFATINSIYNKAMHTGAFNICLVDECHNISRKETGMYRRMIADYTRINPRFRTIGFTGTPFRGNGVLLTEGDEALFTDIASTISIKDMIEQGYLSPLSIKKTSVKTDVTGVKINNATGDYNIKQLANAIDKESITYAAVDEIIEAGYDRKAWLIFGVSIEHCEHINAALIARGINSAIVHGKTPKSQRDKLLANFKAGRIQALVNCMILTTGFDYPGIDLIALIRNTKSPVLYIQMAGRGLRTANNKEDCLWLDFTDTTSTLGPIDQIMGRKEPKKITDQSATLKICPVCQVECHFSSRLCECGHEFELTQSESIRAYAGDAPILSGSKQLIEISRLNFRLHTKPEKPDSLCVTYIQKDLRKENFKEWQCFNHEGYPRRKAENWWLKMGGKSPFPATVQESIERKHELNKPELISVRKKGRYSEIIDYVFNTKN